MKDKNDSVKKTAPKINLPIKCIELILEQAGVIAITDEDARYVYVNERWCDDTGIKREDALGKLNHELVEGYRAITAIRSKKAVTGEMLIRRKDGKDLPGVMSYMPIFDDDNNKVVGCFISSSFVSVEQAHAFMEKMDFVSAELEYLKGEMKKKNGAKYSIDDILGKSDAIKRLKENIYIAGASDSTVLIEGETGTGKELVAHSIHNCSIRNAFPFVKVNCSAIPENLMEAEFFGYEEGAFTGASKKGQIGKFEKAHLGSIFLDEVNHLDMYMQPKLLRVLQEKEVEHIGSSDSISIDARIIAGTNVPLKKMVKQGTFREDLYYRFNIIHINTPPLRERKEDIPILVDFFLEQLNGNSLKKINGVDKDAMDYLKKQRWHGNVRELHNKIEKAYNIEKGSSISADSLIDYEDDFDSRNENEMPAMETVAKGPLDSRLLASKDDLEKEMIINALKNCGDNKSKAAEQLGISRTLLYKKIKKYDI